MSDKLLTITIPVYNTEDYLARCVDSLLIEDDLLNLLEILIIIDGSPDNSYEIALEYQNKYPNVIRAVNKENGGHGSTINTGIKLAKGKYFKVLDSDDWFDTADFKLFLEYLLETDVDIVLTDYVREYLFDKYSVDMPLPNFTKNKVCKVRELDFTKQDSTIFAMARSTIKHKLLIDSRLVLPEKIFYVDTIFAMVPFFYAKTIVYRDFKLYRYFIGRENQSVTIENTVKNRKHLRIVFFEIVSRFANLRDLLGNNMKKNIIQFLNVMASGQFLYICYLDFEKAKEEAKEWDNDLKQFSHILGYTKVGLGYRILPFKIFYSLMQKKISNKNI